MTNPKTKVKLIGICALCLFWILCLGICHLSFAQDKIVAIVNNDIITQKDLNDFINFMRIQLSQEYKGERLESKIQSMKLDLLDRLVEDRLILQEAKSNNIKIDEARIKAKTDEIKKRYPSDIEFQNALGKQGLVKGDLEVRIKEQLLMYSIIDEKVRGKIVVSPTEVTDFYQKNIDEFKLPAQYEFQALSIENENLANQVLNELKNGDEAQDLVKKYSLSANKVSAIKDGQLRKDIEEAVFKLKIGEVSEPIKIEDKYYIFKLENITAARVQSLSEVQDRTHTFLFDKEMQERLAGWLDELKKHSYIKISDGY